jgi:hypothetical protein
MPSTHISDAKGLTHAGGNGLHISSDVRVTGNATFLGNVSGITADVSSRCAEIGSPVDSFKYNCAGNVRYFRHASAPTANWQADFCGLSLREGQGATVKVALVTSETVECYLEDVLVDGNPVTSFATASVYGIKIKKGAKHGIITFDIMKNEAGEIHVFAEVSQDLVL